MIKLAVYVRAYTFKRCCHRTQCSRPHALLCHTGAYNTYPHTVLYGSRAWQCMYAHTLHFIAPSYGSIDAHECAARAQHCMRAQTALCSQSTLYVHYSLLYAPTVYCRKTGCVTFVLCALLFFHTICAPTIPFAAQDVSGRSTGPLSYTPNVFTVHGRCKWWTHITPMCAPRASAVHCSA